MFALSSLHVDWFEDWHDDLDAALDLLPELEECPHDLYRELCIVRGEVVKRTALVTRRGEPIAVVGLRLDGMNWVPVATWVVPGTLFPIGKCGIIELLRSLDTPVSIAWWRQASEPPAEIVRRSEVVDTHKLSCVEGYDYEEYWERTGQMKAVRAARRRCSHLEVAINPAGSISWTLDNWGRRWAQTGHREVIDTCERRVLARYWQPRGRQFCISLMDGNEFAASAVVYVHNGEVVGQANFRQSKYDKLNVGTRLLDAVQSWAKSMRFQKHDFGGGHDYKDKWAPVDGCRWQFSLKPGASSLRRVAEAIGFVKTTE